jgi:predicted NAD/FAD-binding protein
MSFGVSCQRCGIEYSTRGPRGLFARPTQLLRLGHWRLLVDLVRFGRHGRRFLSGTIDHGRTVDELLTSGGYGPDFVRHFLLPMGAAIWSAPSAEIRRFPAHSFLRFFANHGWLTLTGAHQWWTVRGGSRQYVDAIARPLSERLHLASPVRSVTRTEDSVVVRLVDDEQPRKFDAVVLATHADQALRLLADPSPEERRLLSGFRYSENRVVLHTDASVLPKSRSAWAAWNCQLDDCSAESSPVSLTYDLNRLQSLDTTEQVSATLNPCRPLAGPLLADLTYTHPVLDATAVEMQEGLKGLSGERRTYYCGAHLRYGFHEDGLLSAMDVAARFGIAP